MSHRVRCGVLAVREDQLLMFRGVDPTAGEHWGPPAGGLKGAESIWECATREFFEETGARALDLELAYVQQYVTNDTNQVTFLFISERLEGTPSAQGTGDETSEWIQEIVWLSEDQLPGKVVIPPFISDRFFADYRDGFKSPIYVPAANLT